MSDAENSDDERYENEPFENESDTDVPETYRYGSGSSEAGDGDEEEYDDDDLPSVKGPIEINNFPNNVTIINRTDMRTFALSSDEEDGVVIGETMAEINTQSINLDEAQTARYIYSEDSLLVVNGEQNTRASSEEISEEDDEEDEELQKIKEMEEKYLQKFSMKVRLGAGLEAKTENLSPQVNENESQSDNENDDTQEEEQEFESQEESALTSTENYLLSPKTDICDNNPSESQDDTIEGIQPSSIMQLIRSSLEHLKMSDSNTDNSNFTNMCQTHLPTDFINISSSRTSTINAETIALAVVNALKNSGLTNSQPQNVDQNREQAEGIEENKEETVNSTNSNGNCSETTDMAVVPYTGVSEDQKEIEVEEIERNSDEDQKTCDNHFHYQISSRTPTSFNSDDYIFHTKIIKQETDYGDKLRAKPYPRKSMSFSNERMREIDRHNQILLRKILSQKPTYTLKKKSSQSSLKKSPPQSNARLTTSAVNRKKQQRQIDLDNQTLKRRIEAIALRKHPLMS